MKDLKGDVIDAYLRAPDVHETHRVGLYGVGISLVIAVLAVVVHGFNTWLFFWTNTPKIIPVLLHVLAVAVVFFFAFSLNKARRGKVRRNAGFRYSLRMRHGACVLRGSRQAAYRKHTACAYT